MGKIEWYLTTTTAKNTCNLCIDLEMSVTHVFCPVWQPCSINVSYMSLQWPLMCPNSLDTRALIAPLVSSRLFQSEAISTLHKARGGDYWANFLRSVIFRNFQHCQNTCYLMNITFIFDRCHRSSAAVAPVKYECDSNNLRSTFEWWKFFLMEKLMNGALVTPTPVLITAGWSIKKISHTVLYW